MRARARLYVGIRVRSRASDASVVEGPCGKRSALSCCRFLQYISLLPFKVKCESKINANKILSGYKFEPLASYKLHSHLKAP